MTWPSKTANLTAETAARRFLHLGRCGADLLEAAGRRPLAFGTAAYRNGRGAIATSVRRFARKLASVERLFQVLCRFISSKTQFLTVCSIRLWGPGKIAIPFLYLRDNIQT